MSRRKFLRQPRLWPRAFGYELTHSPTPLNVGRTHPDISFDGDFVKLCRSCGPFTMTSLERMWGLYESVRNIEARQIPGDIVECGVWKGGSSMLAASTLLKLGQRTRMSSRGDELSTISYRHAGRVTK
jgi:hypothetical protein